MHIDVEHNETENTIDIVWPGQIVRATAILELTRLIFALHSQQTPNLFQVEIHRTPFLIHNQTSNDGGACGK